ncbi:MAG TPA: carboxypeptidase-like regulatory domain-containing protein [Blastocatellia bacterium]|nr:carboxypeptidase-like regulatory domain-containing protein [Blastocatellia bacterium]HMZ20485.1 carboxypeptidase-like regulatory domain-containing protein [Blastocatellia bacterium]HNG32297.1 carboxypeptidase-like regulatory domain-containing protein [Blastocatellia bacterium]
MSRYLFPTRSLRKLTATVLLTLCCALAALAQTATTGAIVGSVTDKNGAVLSGAEVELVNAATNQSVKTTTNSEGQYTFPAVAPGSYTVTFSKAGFNKANVANFKVDVAKSYTVPIALEVGNVQQTVEVTATAGLELQTTDSTVGNAIAGKEMPLLPALTRQANDLLRIQPLSTPGGEVAGSRNDQTTITLDGIDVTNQSTGGLGTVIPIPIDSIEEFRVGVANPNAAFGRGAGGQASVISRRGTNDYHGLLFWYHQNDNLNAATWTAKRTIAQTVTDPVARAKQQEPELKDNRFGFRFGGPVIPWSDAWKKKLFFFTNYEGRRFPRTSQILRIVPNDTLRQGILRFRDASGTVNSYDLKTAKLCGPNGDLACDPRGVGISPVVSNLFKNLPAGNDPSAGDGFNTSGYRGIVTNPLNNDFYNSRFDYNINDKWRADVAFRYFREANVGSGLLDIRGGNVKSRELLPTRQNMIVAGASGLITNNLSGEFRFGWVRTRTALDRLRPNGSAAELALAGTETGFSTGQSHVALDLGARGGAQSILSEPIDVDTQLARKQSNDNKNIQWNADLNWVRGSHTWQFGTHIRYLPTLHRRDDKVLGALGALVAQVDSELGAFSLPATVRPPTCSATVTRNCLVAADVQTWNRTLASVLGIVDNVSVLAVRDGNLKPLPFGETLEADTKLWVPEFYWQDVWRIKPSLTLTYGLNYGWQTAPTERLKRQSIQVDGQTLTAQTAREYLATKQAIAKEGGIFNPPIAYQPISNAGRSVFDVDYNNIAPRVAVSWNPNSNSGFLGKLLGERKTVVRGGYSLIFDRQNTVQSVIIPTLGVAFAQTINITTPLCNASAAAGLGCDPTSANPAQNLYRVGVDGRIPLPVVPTLSIPVSPFWGRNANGTLTLFPETLSFQVDPKIQVGENHALNLTVQREMPGNILVEAGFIGRYAKKLPQSMNLGQAPYNHLDRASGQTFAQAFDAVARQLRTGTLASAVTPQPWFENQSPGGTRVLAAATTSNFINGNINNIFLNIDQRRLLAGLPSFNNYLSQSFLLRSSTGSSNYNAAFVTLNKRFSRGLLATVNYTFARSMDQLGANQNSANTTPNSFDLTVEYGPSTFDITHILNSTFRYDLPFGKGRFFNTGNVLDKVVGGWYLSGIYTARSGDALTVVQGAGVWGGSLFLGFNSGAIPTTDPSSFGNETNRGINGSNNIGTNGDPANRGTGLNLFNNPEQVFNSLRRVEISNDGRTGRANPFRGPSRWNVDLSLGKQTTIKEGLKVTFLADFFNAFNNVIFANPTLDLNNSRAFGVLTTQFIAPERGGTAGSRWIQLGLRIEF